GSIVDVRETIASGRVPARNIIIDATKELGLRDPAELNELMLVRLRTLVSEGKAIAGKEPDRGKRILAPMEGIVVYVGEGRIIMQETPEIIELEAGVRGQVVQVLGNRGVAIEATGGVVQGVWGNDRTVIASVRFEPLDGLESLSADDLDTTYRGDIVVTKTPLTARKLRIAAGQAFAGLIAPSMDASLIPRALNSKMAIMLTTGFGDFRIRRNAMNVLEAYENYQAALDAALPQRFDDRRAELVFHQHTREEIPTAYGIPLEVGLFVRITSDPYAGRGGEIVELPSQLVRLENGLRVRGAYVEIGVDEIVPVPLANLELAGI
ncbi:MAG: hypothetical protein AAFN11_22055, partial [Chloroflexota bacterium]